MKNKFLNVWSLPNILPLCVRKDTFYANYFTILSALVLFLTPSVLEAQITLDLLKTAAPTAIAPGNQSIYTILYSCSSLTDPCAGAVVPAL